MTAAHADLAELYWNFEAHISGVGDSIVQTETRPVAPAGSPASPPRPESEPEAKGTKDAAGQRPVWTGRGPTLAGLPGASALSPAGRRRFPPRRRGCRAASAPSWGDVHRAPAAVTGPGGHSLDGRPWPWGLVLPPPQGLAGPPLCTQGPLLCGRRSRTAGRDFSLSAADRGLFSGHTTSESVRTSVQGEAQLYLPVGAHTRACVMYTCTHACKTHTHVYTCRCGMSAACFPSWLLHFRGVGETLCRLRVKAAV